MLLLTLALLVVFSFTLRDFSSISNFLNLVRSISILGHPRPRNGADRHQPGHRPQHGLDHGGCMVYSAGPDRAGMPIGAAMLLSLFIAALIGTVNGIIIAFVEAPPLFVTLAASFVIYGMAFWIAPAWVVYAPKNAPSCFILGRGCCWTFRCPSSCFWLRLRPCIFFLSKTSLGGSSMRRATIPKLLGLRVFGCVR